MFPIGTGNSRANAEPIGVIGRDVDPGGEGDLGAVTTVAIVAIVATVATDGLAKPGAGTLFLALSPP